MIGASFRPNAGRCRPQRRARRTLRPLPCWTAQPRGRARGAPACVVQNARNPDWARKPQPDRRVSRMRTQTRHHWHRHRSPCHRGGRTYRAPTVRAHPTLPHQRSFAENRAKKAQAWSRAVLSGTAPYWLTPPPTIDTATNSKLMRHLGRDYGRALKQLLQKNLAPCPAPLPGHDVALAPVARSHESSWLRRKSAFAMMYQPTVTRHKKLPLALRWLRQRTTAQRKWLRLDDLVPGF